ncbi:MAG: hypothetical protein GX432_01915, partial [Candidatus Atribacteria bacterium]|nr:hypothetical protein [Candidatus Atribacteria bacterium]
MKTPFKKHMFIICFVLLIAISFSCISFAAGKTLVFIAGPQGNVLWEQLIPQWEEKTGNKIDFINIPREEFDAFLKSRIAAGSQIDLIM